MKKNIFFLFIFFATITGYSQSGNFKVYSIEEGLPQSQVFAALQDNEGYIWFGTGGGLSRFNGKTFTTFTIEDSLASNSINTLFLDNEKQLWIGTSTGISLIRGQKIIPLPASLKKLAQDNIRSINKGTDNAIWICSNNGAYLWNGNQLISYPELSGKQINVVFTDSKNITWFGTESQGIIMLKDHSFQTFTTLNGLESNFITCIAEDIEGAIWFGSENGITVFSDKNFERFKHEIFYKTHIKTLFKDRQGNIGIGTSGAGVFRYDGTNLRSFTTRQGLSNDGINCIFEDREGNIWLGTDGGGVLKYISSSFYSLSEKQGLLNNIVLSICNDSKGNTWFGTFRGVSKFDGNEFTNYDKSNGLSSEKIWGIIEDDNKNIWIGTYGDGIFKYNGKSFKNYKESDGLSSNSVRTVFKDSENNIWIGTLNGLNKFNGGKFEKFTIENGLPGNKILTIFEDSKNQIWIGTSSGGLCKITKEHGKLRFTTYNTQQGLADNTISCITEDKNSFLWVSTFNGLSHLSITGEKKIDNFYKKDGFSSNTMYVAVIDKKNTLLIGTNKGIDKLDLHEFYQTGNVNIKHYGKDEGFTGQECNTNAYTKDKNGNIWFGSIQGAVLYNSEQEKPNIIEPLLHITDIRLFFQEQDFKKFSDSIDPDTGLPVNLILPYDKNHITFDFIGISTTVPERVRYKFMLKGFDKNWSPLTSEQTATYSNLPPGKYIFMVLAGNEDGVWMNAPVEFAFNIKPPFWRTWWFYVFSLLALIFSVYGIFAYRLNHLNKAKENLEKQVSLKTIQLREEKEIVELQKKEIENKNLNITASIKYAQRIQQAVFPEKDTLQEFLPQSFILFKPRDIVSGDFYWFAKNNGKIIVAAADCTGHGVPGAFMSLIGNSLLTEIVLHNSVQDPSDILQLMHEQLIVTLKKEAKESSTVDGMDVSLVIIDETHKKIEFASTGRPLIYLSDEKIKMIRTGKHPLGLVHKKEKRYETYHLDIKTGDFIYIFTDGFCDQFGGETGEKFLYSRFHDLLLSIKNEDIKLQEGLLEDRLKTWRGDIPQLDDILVIGMKF